MSLATRAVPAVPSDIVRCGFCGQECWLSTATGQSTIAAARALGTPRFACDTCLTMMNNRLRISFAVTKQVIAEAADHPG